jgi:large subunit ribosomal protein L25
MADITLLAEPGREAGSRSSRRLRALGRIPAVVYGHGIEPIPVSVDARELRSALSTEAGTRALLQLKIGKNSHLAMARQLQRHPVRRTVTHVDFQVVSRDEVVTAEIPIVLVGEAVAVQQGGGVVDLELQSLAIKAKPADLPPSIEVDISSLEIGGSIRLSDIDLPPGVQTDVDAEHLVVVGRPPQITALPEEAAGEEAQGEGGAEAGGTTGAGEGAGGEAAASGEASSEGGGESS